ncbi:MAG: wax ester/triacylglycerol synthase domain-containing protein [Actinomycetota bacterium]
MSEREQRFSDRMSDAEALMWNVEKDPWLNPSGGSLTMLDHPPDREHFEQTMRVAASKLPRLYERVVPGLGRIAPPAWVPDAEFDFDYHVRYLRLPAPGTTRQLFDLATQLYLEPLDRTRPLWRFVVIEGLEDGRAALWSILHHAVADGIGQMRMAELFQQFAPDAPPPDAVDLDAVIASAVEAHDAKQLGGDLAEGLPTTVVQSVGHLVRRQAGVARRALGEVAMWPADPERARQRLDDATGSVSATVNSLRRSGDEVAGGSPLWKHRSRHRHLEEVTSTLSGLKKASKQADVTINDLFLAAMAEGAARYHHERGVEVEAFNSSFVLSTRHDDAVGGNSFTPVPVQLPGEKQSLDARVADTHQRLAAKREAMSHGGGLGALSSVANLFPTSMVTSMARAQAAKIDFATSNLRGSPIPLYVSGARVDRLIAMGPVAGTACNATALSYEDQFVVGIFLDPVAIDAPGDFRDAVASAFDDIVS